MIASQSAGIDVSYFRPLAWIATPEYSTVPVASSRVSVRRRSSKACVTGLTVILWRKAQGQRGDRVEVRRGDAGRRGHPDRRQLGRAGVDQALADAEQEVIRHLEVGRDEDEVARLLVA